MPGQITRRQSVPLVAACLVVAAAVLIHHASGPGFDSNREWIIGTDNSAPYHWLTESGEARGMNADLVAEAARRAGIRLRWQYRSDGPVQALAQHKVDIWPLISVNLGRPGIVFTRPYLRNAYALLSTSPDVAFHPETNLRRLALAGMLLPSQLAAASMPNATQVFAHNRSGALQLLCRGEADAVILEARAAQWLMLNRPPGCESHNFFPSGLGLKPQPLGLASTPEAAAVANRLRLEIDRMLTDGTMTALMRPWNYFYSGEAETIHDQRVAESARTVSGALAAVLALLATLLFVLLLRVRHAQQAAQAANAAKSQFLASMSHEIRTPLNGVLGIAQVLRQSPLDPDQRECVDILTSTGQNLLAIVNDLLDLARVERGKIELSLAPADPRAEIAAALKVFQIVARDKQLRYSWTGLDSLPPRVMMDAGRVRQIVSNLVGNAIKFTDQGAVTVTVSHHPTADGIILHLAVTDTGIGIPEHTRSQLFERFVQGHPSIAKRFGGTGLGLAITRELVTRMGGTISVESKPGAGSTFSVAIPATLAAPPPHPASSDAGAASVAGAILLVEDNPVNQKVASKLLSLGGHTVVASADGASAIDQWRQGKFDLILMDCQMPGMDGYETTAEIRRLENGQRHIPIVALTAAAMKGEQERCLAAGMDDYLTKPIDLIQLNRVLTTWLAPAAKVMRQGS